VKHKVLIAGTERLILVHQRLALDDESAFKTVVSLDLHEGQASTLHFSNEGTDGFVVVDAVQILAQTKA